MATIVKHIRTDSRYLLIGTGFGAFQSKKPSWLLGNFIADTNEGQYPMACVCDANGQLGWLLSSEIVVESIDGQSVMDAFGASPKLS